MRWILRQCSFYVPVACLCQADNAQLPLSNFCTYHFSGQRTLRRQSVLLFAVDRTVPSALIDSLETPLSINLLGASSHVTYTQH